MTVLLVGPALPAHHDALVALGQAFQREGHRVLVATGASLRDQTVADGLEHVELDVGGADDPAALDVPTGVGDEALRRRFVDATRRGMLASLRYHASWRQQAPVFRPLGTTLRLARILHEVTPDLIVVDRTADSATLALRALRRPWVGVVPTHPWSLPGDGRPYGYPSVRPAEMRGEAPGLLHLRKLWTEAGERFTAELNRLLVGMDPEARRLTSAWAAAPLLDLFLYPEALAGPWRDRVPGRAAFLGAAVPRTREATGFPESHRPSVMVTLGERLSARSDVLRRIVEALRAQPVRVLLEHGETGPDELGPVADSWIVERRLPRDAALATADLVIGHAGNDLVTHALSRGTPLLVAPFAADHYAGAADLRRAGVGEVFDPDHADAADIAVLTRRLLADAPRRRARRIAAEMASDPGPRRAVRLCRAILEDSRAQVA